MKEEQIFFFLKGESLRIKIKYYYNVLRADNK